MSKGQREKHIAHCAEVMRKLETEYGTMESIPSEEYDYMFKLWGIQDSNEALQDLLKILKPGRDSDDDDDNEIETENVNQNEITCMVWFFL